MKMESLCHARRPLPTTPTFGTKHAVTHVHMEHMHMHPPQPMRRRHRGPLHISSFRPYCSVGPEPMPISAREHAHAVAQDEIYVVQSSIYIVLA